MIDKIGLSEVIVHNSILINTNTIKIIGHSLDEHWRSTEIVLTVLRCFMILKILITDTVNRKACVILYSCLISLRVISSH